MHPLDEPEGPEQRAYGLYHGSVGVVWALRELSRRGFVDAATFTFGRAPFDIGLLARLTEHTERELRDARASTARPRSFSVSPLQRFGEAVWLDRARALGLHAAAQVERCRARHGMGRHSLWTGDLGVACVLAQSIDDDARFPSLEHFAWPRAVSRCSAASPATRR